LLDLPGNPEWKMLGTNAFISDEKFSATVNHESGYVNQTRKQKVLHEGWGGKTWKWHLQEGKFCRQGGEIDIACYLDEYCNGDRPDIVIFMLGINDCFTADANQPEKAISECVGYSEKLISEFSRELPASQIGICLIPGPNLFESSFESCYAGEYTRWGWKQIQHALNKNIIEHYCRRGGENISLIATSLVIDPVLGYPYDNGVHPNEYGYNQLADQIYGWIKTVM
jgi:hypothetical protein